MKTKHNKTLSSMIAFSMAAAGAAFAADPAEKPDDSWISLSGKVSEVSPQSFILNYDGGTITVEFDDWDMDADAYKLVEGDNVVVRGYIDDGFFEKRTIEAGSVYVEGLNTYFYASAADEEGDALYTSYYVTAPVVVGAYDVTGTVESVTGREFTLDTGVTDLKVDTASMSYNPMDDEGFQKIEKGDRVTVYGNYDVNIFDTNEVDATTIVTLDDASE